MPPKQKPPPPRAPRKPLTKRQVDVEIASIQDQMRLRAWQTLHAIETAGLALARYAFALLCETAFFWLLFFSLQGDAEKYAMLRTWIEWAQILIGVATVIVGLIHAFSGAAAQIATDLRSTARSIKGEDDDATF